MYNWPKLTNPAWLELYSNDGGDNYHFKFLITPCIPYAPIFSSLTWKLRHSHHGVYLGRKSNSHFRCVRLEKPFANELSKQYKDVMLTNIVHLDDCIISRKLVFIIDYPRHETRIIS